MGNARGKVCLSTNTRQLKSPSDSLTKGGHIFHGGMATGNAEPGFAEPVICISPMGIVTIWGYRGYFCFLGSMLCFFCFNPWAFGPVGSKADQILWMWCQPVATGKFIVFMESLLLILEELLEQRAYKELWPAWATWLRPWIHSYIYVICNSLYVEIGLESDRLTSSIV